MIFLYAQSLDANASHVVLWDGEAASTDQPAIKAVRDVVFLACEQPSLESRQGCELRVHQSMVVLKVPTEQVDVHGRPAPIFAAFWMDDIRPELVSKTIQSLLDAAQSMGRSFDQESVESLLAEWTQRAWVRAWRRMLDILSRGFEGGVRMMRNLDLPIGGPGA